MNKINTLSIFLLCSAIQILSSEELGHKELSRANLYDSIIKKHPDSECRQKCELVAKEACCYCLAITSMPLVSLVCLGCGLGTNPETLARDGALFGGAIFGGVVGGAASLKTAIEKMNVFDQYKMTRAMH